MKTPTAKKVHAGSTQAFTEIEDITDAIVLLRGNYACSLIEVQANNFPLLSQEEQNAKIYGYTSLLNSLSYPIQIIIRTQKMDISSYVNLLDLELGKLNTPQNINMTPVQQQKVKMHMQLYKRFVQQLVQVNTVLNKQFYIVISYSFLEAGAISATKTVGKTSNEFVRAAKTTLEIKAGEIISQLSGMGLLAKALEKEELITVFYSLYNENLLNPVSEQQQNAIAVKGRKNS